MDTRVQVNKVPGGMMSNLANTLKSRARWSASTKCLPRFREVREDLGFHTTGHTDFTDRWQPGGIQCARR